MFQKSAMDFWSEESQRAGISTMCKSLDLSLGNGVPCGIITEFHGPPGSGKTQICYQLCVSVQLPTQLNGPNGSAIYIETKQGYSPIRLKEIADGMEIYCSKAYKLNQNDCRKLELNLTACEIMKNIMTVATNDLIEFIAAVHSLNDLIEDMANIKEVRLIIIDSFTFPFKFMENMSERTRLIYETLTELQRLANKFHCAIVLTNEITTRWFDNKPQFHPALGDSYQHKIGQQITLDSDLNGSGIFTATIKKNIYKPENQIVFTITETGIN